MIPNRSIILGGMASCYFGSISIGGELVDPPCEEAGDGGGVPWTVIQRRGQFGNPPNYFAKLWNDYRAGFGNVDGEFWLGLDNMAEMTRQGNWELRVDLTDWDGAEYFALYDHFQVGPGPNYQLSLSGFNSVSTLGDSLTRADWQNLNGMSFSTSDRDNDKHSGNCAATYRGGGGWWYNSCSWANLNGKNYETQKNDASSIGWFYGGSRPGSSRSWNSWQQAKMKTRKSN